MNVFIQTNIEPFFSTIVKLFEHVEKVDAAVIDKGKFKANEEDLLFVEQIPVCGFFRVRAKVIVISASENRQDEFTAASMGAVGYLSTSATESQIRSAAQCVASGEVWMSRETVACVFAEYSKLVARGNNV